MKIYFTAAISQFSEYKNHYKRIIEVLENMNYKVQYEHIMHKSLSEVFDDSDEEKLAYYRKFLGWINSSDLVVAEASFPSTVNVGHEISVALEKGRPVLVMYLKGKSPIFIEGIKDEKVLVIEYSEDDLEEVLSAALDYLGSQQDTRFNFFISPKHQNYLDWISQKQKIPRAVFLRRLIEADMEQNEDFS